jgi:KH domain
VIEGDALGVKIASDEILSIANEQASTVNLSLKGIPAEFYPFIAGPNNARTNTLEEGRNIRIHVPHYHTWTTQPPPQASPIVNQLPAFLPSVGMPIRIAGDRLAAQQAREEIERWVEELRGQIALEEISVDKGRHRFILGGRGNSLHDFLQETGCAVVLPPSSENRETLTIIGPQNRLSDGVNKALELATTMHSTSVDISRQHLNASHGPLIHARNLTRYLKQRKEIERLERFFDTHIVLPTNDGPVIWEIYSRTGKNTYLARTEINNIVNAHPPARIGHVEIDPFFHHYIRQQSAHVAKENYGVHLVFPEEDEENHQILLVYEGKPVSGQDYELPKKAPSTAELREAELAIQEASEHLLDLIRDQREIVKKGIEIPKKYVWTLVYHFFDNYD